MPFYAAYLTEKKWLFGVPAIKQVRLLYVPLIFSTEIKQCRY